MTKLALLVLIGLTAMSSTTFAGKRIVAGVHMSTGEIDQLDRLIQKRWSVVMKEPIPSGGLSITRRLDERPAGAGGRKCYVKDRVRDVRGTFQYWHCD